MIALVLSTCKYLSCMKKSLLVISSAVILFMVVFAINSCHRSTHSVSHQHSSPKVYRSVLDLIPRMASVALEDSFWVAYNATYGGLYKVWKDGVLFDGPVFTTAHGPQPTSVGAAWLISDEANPWRLIRDGKEITPQVEYLGHTVDAHGVTFKLELRDDQGHTISLTESPQKVENKYKLPGLKRTFKTADVPAGTQIVLITPVNSVRSYDDIHTNGKLEFTSSDSRTFDWIYILEGTARLTLRSNTSTNLTLYFYPEPTILPSVAETSEEEEVHPGFALIERSDCKTCHNEEVKTIGPAYVDIAEKYEFTQASIASLSQKVIKGGSGVWGEQAMSPHPDLMPADAAQMVSYILSLDGESPPEASEASAEDLGQPDPGHGFIVNVYKLTHDVSNVPSMEETQAPVYSGVVPALDFENQSFPGGMEDNYYVHASGILNIPQESNYVFRLISDDGSILRIDGEVVVDNDGLHGAEAIDGEIILKAGEHPFTVDYFEGGGGSKLSLQWIAYGEADFSLVPHTVVTHDSTNLKEAKKFIPRYELVNGIPGDSLPLNDVHPSFDLATIRPSWFEPKVGGMDFLPNGKLLVSTWDPEGSVFLLDNIQKSLEQNNPEIITVKRIAKGLAEPLGLKVVDGEIYVLQKQELTQLIDHNGDEIIDEYRTVCNDWKVSANFHEFAFGLVYKEGYFYATLATAINPGGASTKPQIPDRGKVVKISRKDGSMEFIASGLRTPNGIAMDQRGEIFVADNQGDWLPASKILHILPGKWYGSRSVDFEGTASLTEKPPVMWLPQDEIGNSPSQPSYLDVGPFKGQMIHGEVTHGGIKRIFTEEVNGQLQGALFRFTQGLEAGVNRLVWGPDGALYIGGVGNPGNWGHVGKQWYGLQRLEYNGNPTFEMLAVRAKTDGLEIEFTEPLKVNDGYNPADYLVQQWRYVPTENYGGPKVDKENLRIADVRVSEDRKRVFLQLPGIREGHMVYIHLKKNFVSAHENSIWTTEAWYNMNQIPENKPGFTNSVAWEKVENNQLTEAEKADGWRLLFDGKTTNGWRRYNGEGMGSSWVVEDGTLALNGAKEDGKFADGGYIITEQEYENYELQLEWKISEGGNSGVIYHVNEDKKYKNPWETGPELQVLDNERHRDAQIVTHRSGDLYDLMASTVVTTKLAGEWNHIRLIVRENHIEHWQNGHKVVSYEIGSPEWQALVADSKWKDHPDYGSTRKGHIALQDHGDPVWFRNIKIKRLEGI